MKNKMDSIVNSLMDRTIAGSFDLIEQAVHESIENDLAPELAKAQEEWNRLIDQLRRKDFRYADDLEGAMLDVVHERSRLVWRMAIVSAIKLSDGRQQLASLLRA